MKPGITTEDLWRISVETAAPEEEVRAMLARVPPSWTMRRVGGGELDTSAGQYFTRGSLQVIASLSRYDDGQLWQHVSVCGRTGPKRFHLPSWEDMKRVKRDFFGADRWTYQVFPPDGEYVNDHPCVLHLFARWDGTAALPDFTHGLGTL